MLFDVVKDGAKLATKSVVSEDQQESNESRKLWMSLTEAIINKDMEGATTSKTAVEEAQREHRRKLEEQGKKHAPRFFEEKNGSWVPKLEWVLPLYSLLKSMMLTLTPCLFINPGSRRSRRRKR